MKHSRTTFSFRWFFLLGLLALMAGAAGCATDESNMSSNRPWNKPTGWEHGLPAQLLEGR